MTLLWVVLIINVLSLMILIGFLTTAYFYFIDSETVAAPTKPILSKKSGNKKKPTYFDEETLYKKEIEELKNSRLR